MMREFVHWIQSKDESTRRGFVALCTSVSFLAIFFGWLAFNPFGGLRPQSSPPAEVAGEQADRTVSPSPTPYPKQATPSPDRLPLDLSGISTPSPVSSNDEAPSPTPDMTPSDPLFTPQDNVSSTPEL